ncbi:MAG: TetR/AcrR family transcriptional regulator [Arenibacterium sp.]
MNKSDTKTRLLDMAETLARQNGAEGFSYSDLSAEIGIRKASIHYHFPTKSDLLSALIARYAQTVLERLRVVQDDLPSAAERIDGFIALYRDAIGEGDCLCLCVAYALSPDVLNKATRDCVSAFRRDVLAWLRSVFETGLCDGTINDISTPEKEASAALALVEGAQIAARFSESAAHYDKAVASFRDRLILGQSE